MRSMLDTTSAKRRQVGGARREAPLSISVVNQGYVVPLRLSVDHLNGGLLALERLHPEAPSVNVDVQRARSIAARLSDLAVVLTPSNLKAVYNLDDFDVAVVTHAISWLREHPDLGGWTSRQIPVPGMHRK